MYPSWDLNRGQQLLQQLGSFWAEIFDDRDIVRTHLQSDAHEQYQVYTNFLEAVACVSRFDIPVFHREHWKLLILKQSDADAVPSIYEDDDLVYGPQTGLRPLRPAGFTQTYGGTDNPFFTQVPVPDGLADAKFVIQNKVLAPSRVYVSGIDYDLDRTRGLLRFRSNIFTDPLVPRRTVYNTAGVAIDVEAALWLYMGDWDLDYVYTQFGYVLGLHLNSSQFYKDLLNAYWDAHVLGPSCAAIQSMLAAAVGAPMVLETEETVEVIRIESNRKLLITDQHVYVMPLDATPMAAVGDTVYAGDVLSDAVQVVETSGSNPDYSLLPQVTLGRNLISGDYWSGLTFKNVDVPLVYEGIDADGKAVINFEIGGYPADVSAWWDDALALGKMTGNQTPAELMDTRTAPVGQPTAADLPATVNPLEFCFENFFGRHMFIIVVRQASFSADAPGTAHFSLLRRVMPPHVSYIMFVELSPDADNIDLGDAIDNPSGAVVGEPTDSLSGLQDGAVIAYYSALNCE